MKVRTLFITLLAVAGGLAGAAPASAHHQSPGGCSSNELSVSLKRDRPDGLYIRGDTINYRVSVANNLAASACDVTGVTIVVTLPALDGTPTGQKVTVTPGA